MEKSLPWIKKKRPFTVRDFPGMENVCLYHSMEWADHGDMRWRTGGTAQCACERSSDALIRLRAEAQWARQDEAEARAQAEALEAEVRRIERGKPPTGDLESLRDGTS